MKNIHTLVPDIYAVLEGRGGWDKAITTFLSDGIAEVAESRFSEPQKPRDYLGLSSIGTPCYRKLLYRLRRYGVGE